MTEGAEVGKLSGIAEGCRDGDKPVLTSVVIPAEAGIQESGNAVVNEWQVLPDGIGWSSLWLSSPPGRGCYCINHWIPAFAGRLRASSAACSRRRSTTSAACSRRGSTACVHAGVRPVGVPARRIPDFLSIAATGVLPSRRIPDFLSINDGGGFRPAPGQRDALPLSPVPGRRAGMIKWHKVKMASMIFFRLSLAGRQLCIHRRFPDE